MSSLSSVGGPTSSTGTLSVGGLISGLNTSQLIQGLLAVQQAHISQVQARQSTVTRREVAFKSLQAQLLGLQSSVTGLAQTYNGPFDGRTAASSDPTLLTAAASSSAAPGIYSVTVNTLAQANQVASQGFDSATSQVTHGTLTVGSGSTSATVTIDGTNDTLQGLASAINGANVGVSATVVNDGSSHPYRLLLTANNTGVANAIALTNNLAASGGGAVQPAFATTVQAAADASITLGSGGGALTVTSASNTVNNVINGVTLNLLANNTNKAVQVTVAADTSAAKQAVQGFVTAYNGVVSAIANDVSYDPQTKKAGVLLGDSSILGIEDQLRSLVTGVVAGANPKLGSLSALGITSDDSGQLQINDGQLTKVLSGQVSGVSLSDVRNLFALTGQSTNPGVAFVNATTATKASTAPYGVAITQAAHQAALTADGAPTLDLSGGSSPFTLTVNGQNSNAITVPATHYATAQALVQALQAQINGDGVIGGQQVTVGLANGNLTITSGTYGSASGVAISAAAFLGFSSGNSATGQDVGGSFLVNGASESAKGRGQILTGSAGNASTDGLAVRVSLLDSQVSATPSTPVANVTVSRGLAGQLGDVLNNLLDPVSGRLQTIDQNYQDEVSAYQKTIDELNQQYTAKQNQLTQQFTQLEATLSNLKTAGNFLSAQTTTLQQFNGSGSSKSSG